ncbi:MAG: uncharacterized protein JWP97_397, partial [Labilithrix sp.]|nr:uncharacterized protein [Labilithrix sp.]
MRITFVLFTSVALVLAPLAFAGCASSSSTHAPAAMRGDTFAEMRTVKGEVKVAARGEAARAPYPRERLAEGTEVTLAAGALAWIRRDAGAVWLVEGPAALTMHDDAVALASGRAFVDGEDGPPVRVDTPQGRIELSDGRASVELAPAGAEVYVLRGAARAAGAERAGAGER